MILLPGQWPLPAKNPLTDVPCTGCVSPQGAAGKLTPGYPSNLIFAGRYLDSQATQDYQQPFRTARAFHTVVGPDRIYMINGSAAMMYKTDSFVSRLSAGTLLISPHYRGPGNVADAFLAPDAMFYAESSGWEIQRVDGQERLFGIDYDDRGNVYLAYSLFGWGMLDSSLASVFQYPPSTQVSGDVAPTTIAALRGKSGRYYALVSDGARTNIFDVSAAAPVSLTKNAGFPLTSFGKTAMGRIGVASADRSEVLIYDADTLAAGGAPLTQFSGGPFGGVASDGTNFYAMSSGIVSGAYFAEISVYVPSGNSYALHGTYPVSGGGFGVFSLRFGGGYLVLATEVDLRVWRVLDLIPSEIDFGGYFERYYFANPTAGYVCPSFHNIFDGAVAESAGRQYLIVPGYGIGDLYEFPPSGYVAPPAPPPVLPISPAPPAPTLPQPHSGCPPIVAGQNVFITASAPSGGTQYSPTFTTGETILLGVAGYNYDFGCGEHTFSWSFGDGASVAGQNVTHTYQTAGTYSGSVGVTVGGTTTQITQRFVVVTAQPPSPVVPVVPIQPVPPVVPVVPVVPIQPPPVVPVVPPTQLPASHLSVTNIRKVMSLPPLHGDPCLSTLYAPCYVPGVGLYCMGGHIDGPSNQVFGSPERQADRIWFAPEIEVQLDGSNPQTIVSLGPAELLFDNKIFQWMYSPENWLLSHPLSYIGSLGSPSVVKVGSRYVMAFTASVSDQNVCCGEHGAGNQYGSCSDPWSFFALYFASSPTGLPGSWQLEADPLRVSADVRDPSQVITLDASALYYFPNYAVDRNPVPLGGCKGITACNLLNGGDGYLYLFFEMWTIDPVASVKEFVCRVPIDLGQPVGHNFDFQLYDSDPLGNFSPTWRAVREGCLPSWTQADGWRGQVFATGLGRTARLGDGSLVALTAPSGVIEAQRSLAVVGWSETGPVTGISGVVMQPTPYVDASGLHLCWAERGASCPESNPFYGLSIWQGDLS